MLRIWNRSSLEMLISQRRRLRKKARRTTMTLTLMLI